MDVTSRLELAIDLARRAGELLRSGYGHAGAVRYKGPIDPVTEYDLQGDVARGQKLARKVRASDAAVVVAVGLKAALVAKLEIVDVPVIFCMVLDPARYDGDAAGVWPHGH